MLALWGASYAWGCVQTLAGPAGPIDEFELATPGGKVFVHLDSYSIDLQNNRGLFRGLIVHGPDRAILASAGELIVDPLIPVGDGSAAKVHVRNVFARVVLDSTGQPAALKLLPESDDEPSTSAFAVQVENARVEFVGTGTKTPWRAVAQIGTLTANGADGRWIASADTHWGTEGDVFVVASADDRGLSLKGTFDQWQAAPFLAYYAQTDAGRDLTGLDKLRAASMTATGPVHASLPQEGPFALWANLEVSGRNVRYEEMHADALEADGVATHRGFEGVLVANEGPNKVTFEGAALWEADFEAAGKLAVSTPSPRRLPLWIARSIPPDLDFQDGTFDGWLRWKDDQPHVQGRVTAKHALWGAEALTEPTLDIDADTKVLSARVRSGRYLGAPVTGALRADLSGGGLVGSLNVRDLDVAQVAAKGSQTGWHGSMSGTALVSGTLKSPEFDMRVKGSVSYDGPDGRGLALGALSASGLWKEGVFELRQGSLVGPLGAASAEGSWTQATGAVSGEIFGSGWALDALSSNVQGTGAFSGTLAGTLDDPRIAGRAEVYGLVAAGQTVPLIVAELTADRKQVVATRLEAAKGSARSSGSVGMRFEDGALFGEIRGSGFQVAEWFGNEVGGAVDLDRLAVSGTLDKPLMEAALSSKSLVAYGVRIDSADIRITANRDAAQLERIELVTGGGTVSASGTFDFIKTEGYVRGDADSLPLSRLLATHFDAVDVDGGIGGTFEAHVTPDGLANLAAQGSLAGVVVNGVPFGGGSWTMNSELGVWTGDAMLGQLERFVEIPRFHFSQPDRTLFAEVGAYQMAIDDLVDVVRRYVPSLSASLAERLDTVDGNLDAHIVAQGPLNDPVLDIDVLQADSLVLGGRSLGRVDAAAIRSEGTWNLHRFDWTGGPGTLAVTGTIAPGGTLDVDGELSNFDLSLLTLIEPSLGPVKGQIERFSFLGSGLTDSPEFAATLKGYVGEAGEGPDASRSLLDVNLDSISLGGGLLDAGGKLTYAGVRADLAARLPFSFQGGLPRDKPFEVALSLPRRDMTPAEMSELMGSLDTDASKIAVEGGLKVAGTLDSYRVTGSAKVSAPQVALQGGQTSLEGLEASAQLTDRTLALDVRANSSAGGGVVAKVGTVGTDVQKRLTDFAAKYGDDPKGALAELLGTPLAGSVDIDQLRVRHDAGPNGSADVMAQGKIAVTGTVQAPNLKGDIEVTRANLVLPSEPVETVASGPPVVNPQFDLHVVLLEPASMRASTSTIEMLGDGQLVGTLSAPDLTAMLNVVRGAVKLPNARVALEPGGTMRLRYQGFEDQLAVARLDVDLEGRTNVTALRFGDQVERYAVTVYIRGDLLEDGGIRMTASSEPADLDSDRILRLLGQAELLEGLASVLKPGEKGQFQSALTSLAVPALFDPITERVALSLGLDYLSIEFNALDQTTIGAAKSLGKGLILSGRRQISDPDPGFPQRFDFRLSYRLPVRNRVLGRTTVVVGVDQDRPWKIALEYGIRF